MKCKRLAGLAAANNFTTRLYQYDLKKQHTQNLKKETKKERKMANRKTAKKKQLRERKRQEEARLYVQQLLQGGSKDGNPGNV